MKSESSWWDGPVAVSQVLVGGLLVVLGAQLPGDHPPGWLYVVLGLVWIVLDLYAFWPLWKTLARWLP